MQPVLRHQPHDLCYCGCRYLVDDSFFVANFFDLAEENQQDSFLYEPTGHLLDESYHLLQLGLNDYSEVEKT
jgi:hypothetical protein